MIFIFWLILHACYIAASGAIVGPRQNAKPSRADVAIILLWYVIPLSWLIDRGESPEWLFVVGLAMYGTGAALVTAARKVNPHFVPQIVKPPEVIRGGVYRMKHPGYCGMIAMGLGTVLMLGTIAGVIPLCAYSVILCVRAWEEGMLIAGLDPVRKLPASVHR